MALVVSSSTYIKLKRADPRRQVKAAARRVVFLRIPEGAVVGGIQRHGAIVSPTMERVELHAAAVHKHQRSEQGACRIGGCAASDVHAWKHVMTGSAEAEGEIADFIHGDAAEPRGHVRPDRRGRRGTSRSRGITIPAPRNA